jgi:predicted metal-dependent hydrolase
MHDLDTFYRDEFGRVLASVLRHIRDFRVAEEAVQDAFAVALEQWVRDGWPTNPRAWLISTARHKAIDTLRRDGRFEQIRGELRNTSDTIAKMPEPGDSADSTPAIGLGVTITPRQPRFDFEGLEREVPRAWHPAGIGPTAFLESISAMAPVVESFFIDDARRLLPRLSDAARRAEGDAFVRQEATHACMHAAFNRQLVRWGVPVHPIQYSTLRWLAFVDWTSSDLRSAVAMAGEHFLGEIGNAILTRPELLDGADPRIAGLFRWHGYEEVEHKAVLFDVFHAVRGHGLYTYAVRIAGLWIAVVLLVLVLPWVCYRILASSHAARDPRAWCGLARFVFGRGGMLRGRWRAIAAYHRRDFHPWRYLDNRHHLAELRDTIVDPACHEYLNKARGGVRAPSVSVT